MKFEIEDVKRFKYAVMTLQSRVEKSEVKDWRLGICNMLFRIEGSICNTYWIMKKILGDTVYEQGLGPDGVFNTEREVFLEFLAYTLTEEDILEICNA